MSSNCSKGPSYIGKKLTHESFWTDNLEKDAEVYVWAKYVTYPLVHHFIVCKVNGCKAEGDDRDVLLVAEWGTCENRQLEKYSCYKLKGDYCFKFNSKIQLQIVVEAINQVSRDKTYSLQQFNCNHWTEEVCKELNNSLTLICISQSPNSIKSFIKQIFCFKSLHYY